MPCAHLIPPLRSATAGLHVVQYDFTAAHRKRKTATASVASPFGLSANDELYLYGLLALTFAQKEPTIDFYATPHYCLRRLGLVDPNSEQGKRYEVFRSAIRRLAGVVYQNDSFYDPIRGEHRDVAFGFLKYSLPLDPDSSRAWHFIWDPQFFRFCQALGGSLQFDFELYRRLDYASRRLFLLLQKIFWRQDHSPDFEVRHLGVHVLGFADTVPTKVIKAKIARCAMRLLDEHVLCLPPQASAVAELFTKQAKGIHKVRFFRGSYFDRKRGSEPKECMENSPLYEPLKEIGFDNAAIRRILDRFKPSLVQEWADITLAAVERGMIKKSPPSYFMHYIQEAEAKRTTPPDWWQELHRRERKERRAERNTAARANPDESFEQYLRCDAREAFDRVMQRVFQGLRDAGQSETEARDNADYMARVHLRQQFLRDHPESDDSRTDISNCVIGPFSWGGGGHLASGNCIAESTQAPQVQSRRLACNLTRAARREMALRVSLSRDALSDMRCGVLRLGRLAVGTIA